MKKIAIFTFHRDYNNGTMLQAYALQSYLKQFAKVEIIDIEFPIEKKNKFLLFFSRIKRFKEILKKIIFNNKIKNNNKIFEKFHSNYINKTTKTYKTFKEIEEDSNKYDILLIGSDQTWNLNFYYSIKFFLLDYIEGNVIKASYAPSLGKSAFSENDKEIYKEALTKFDYLSCREKSNSELLSEIIGKEVTPVLDPTLLISKDKWLELSSKYKIKDKYILCYFLGGNNIEYQFAKKISKEMGLPVYYIYTNQTNIKLGEKFLFDIGPKEFIYLINNAECICTDSFHGIVFSINFNKQFFAFTKRKDDGESDNSRIYNILKEFNLEERYVNSKTVNQKRKEIDYQSVNSLIEQKKEKSEKYLNKIIGGIDE